MATPQTSSTIEHVPASEHGRGFPPFDSSTFASQLLWFAITFIALYLLMSRLGLPRVQGILDARRRRIDEDVAQAQSFKEQSDAALAAHEQALSEARGNAQALAAERREKAAAAAEARRKEVEARLNAHIAEAEKSIAQRRAAAMANVRGIAGEAASAIIERLIGKAPNAQQVDEAVTTVLKR
jgi:F-type H+-transporting ATPase subunit b